MAVRSYTIALDTNVLLELYRFTPEARDELLNVIEQLRDRIWIPHQVVSEYYSRRIDAVKERLKLHEAIPNALDELKRKAAQELHVFAKRCSLTDDDKEKLLTPIEAAFRNATEEVRRHSKAFDLTLERVVSDDPILSRLARILDGRVGQAFDAEDVESLTKEADRRYAEKIPPGYKDAGKRENPHGDFFIWEQMLREVVAREASLLFVTNDAKEDWIAKEGGLTIGAHPELIAEFKKRRNGGDFLIIQLSSFLTFAKEELGAAISPSTLEQAKNLQDSAGAKEAIDVILDAEEVRNIPHLLAAELNRWDSHAGNRRLSARNRQQAMHEGQRVLELLNRLPEVSQAQLANDSVRMKLTRDDWEILKEAFRRSPAAVSRREYGTAPGPAPLSNQGVARHLDDLELMRQRLALEYQDGKHTVDAARTEVDSLRMSEEGGRRLREAERALDSGERRLREILTQISDIDEQIENSRRLINGRINDQTNELQKRLSDSD
ncbi:MULTISPECIES: PIN domain-containing protein [Streptomyces]|uniref:PIN domain-containing protein n=1 Tax=Streptomyces TaxID=1883 RepID=UPI0012FEEEE3|nr:MULTISPECIES: PIN domain-containing protein [Streptomyces]